MFNYLRKKSIFSLMFVSCIAKPKSSIKKNIIQGVLLDPGTKASIKVGDLYSQVVAYLRNISGLGERLRIYTSSSNKNQFCLVISGTEVNTKNLKKKPTEICVIEFENNKVVRKSFSFYTPGTKLKLMSPENPKSSLEEAILSQNSLKLLDQENESLDDWIPNQKLTEIVNANYDIIKEKKKQLGL